jgi:DNA-binding MarR family transcriptional regulator
MQVLRWARDLQGPTAPKGAARPLLQAIILRANQQKRYSCFPSYETLAADCNMDAKTLKRAAKVLEDAGLIRRHVRRNRSNLFVVNVDLIQQEHVKHKAKRDAERQAREREAGFAEFEGCDQQVISSRGGNENNINAAEYTGESAFSMEDVSNASPYIKKSTDGTAKDWRAAWVNR